MDKLTSIREPTEAEIAAVIRAMTSPAPAYDGPTNSLDRMTLLAKGIAQAAITARSEATLSDAPQGWRPIDAVTPKHMQEALLWFPDFVDQERQIGLWFEYDSPYHGVKGQWVGRDDGEPFETFSDLVFPTHIAALPAPPPKDPTHDQ